ncbi:MAG TPA: VOC family protein [Iamia sp.]
MDIPQRITFVTLGARDLPVLRRFYRGLGWHEGEGAGDGFASFDCGGVKLALYPVEMLRDEAAPGTPLPDLAMWNGITLAVNVATRAEVDAVYARALASGAVPVAEPTEREWGGYSGYVAGPEGNRWELAWAP